MPGLPTLAVGQAWAGGHLVIIHLLGARSGRVLARWQRAVQLVARHPGVAAAALRQRRGRPTGEIQQASRDAAQHAALGIRAGGAARCGMLTWLPLRHRARSNRRWGSAVPAARCTLRPSAAWRASSAPACVAERLVGASVKRRQLPGTSRPGRAPTTAQHIGRTRQWWLFKRGMWWTVGGLGLLPSAAACLGVVRACGMAAAQGMAAAPTSPSPLV
mmetsp:Transcript_29766/g.88108  ORF Transcript_29766/g.88108 Transcript_29766/m.88108 type:complete len:217 (+) Transcript_29766:3828-4478(+)